MSNTTAASQVNHLEASSQRILGIDAYRGFVMFLMMAEVLRLQQISENIPESSFWKWLAWHQTHVEWTGCTLHDLIQPSFSFLVGAALPFSLRRRERIGQSRLASIIHAAWRAILLIFLGVFLRSIGHSQTRFTFEDTLSQIGLGYFFLFLIGLYLPRWSLWFAIAIAAVYWGAFALFPAPASDFDYAAVGVNDDWQYHAQGFAAHWNKGSNFAWWFDRHFLNLFSWEDDGGFILDAEKKYLANRGGYATLSFIPTLATMLLGLWAGLLILKEIQSIRKIGWMILAGILSLVAGIVLDRAGVCPIVKRIWTPSWVCFSGGWCFFFLAFFYGICDWLKTHSWSYPLRVIGANSIAAYCLAHLIEEFIVSSFETHFGQDVFSRLAGDNYEPLIKGAVILACYYAILQWMYWRKIFLRI